jgi:hypothetical protein
VRAILICFLMVLALPQALFLILLDYRSPIPNAFPNDSMITAGLVPTDLDGYFTQRERFLITAYAM